MVDHTIPENALQRSGYWYWAHRHNDGWGYNIANAVPLRNELQDGTVEVIARGKALEGSRCPLGVLGASGYQSQEAALLGAEHRISERERRTKSIRHALNLGSKNNGAKGVITKSKKNEGTKIAKQVTAALIFSVSTTNGKLDFGQFVYGATNLRNPNDGWKGYLIPGFRILVEALEAGQREQLLDRIEPLISKMTKSEAASAQERLSRVGASEDATQLKRVRDILNAYRARDFLRSSESESVRESVLSGLAAFEQWLHSQKLDYTQQADEVKSLSRKLSA